MKHVKNFATTGNSIIFYNGSSFFNNVYLTITNVTKEDQGIYTCEVDNIIQKSLQLKVHGNH